MRALVILAPLLVAASAAAQPLAGTDDPDAARAALRQALVERQEAESRSRRLAREAQAARDAAERTAREGAALAARVQQAEAGISAALARISLIARERAALREALGAQQGPVIRLTAALQQFSRRPIALAVLRPGSVQDVVYLRAMLSTAVPQVQARTEGLRGQLARGRQLRREAERAVQVLRAEQTALAERSQELAALETRQRLASREASGTASREAERALALGEEARDLDGLLDELARAGSLRDRLAALPGPLLRPDRPEEARAAPASLRVEVAEQGSPPTPYLLPVNGRAVIGFGAPGPAGASRGLTLVPRAGAQVIAPARGRVAFAGPYRGYDRIVIIEHPGGWTTLVTGLVRVDVEVGEQLVGGAPLGIAPQVDPAITLELRRDGVPVNPLRFAG